MWRCIRRQLQFSCSMYVPCGERLSTMAGAIVPSVSDNLCSYARTKIRLPIWSGLIHSNTGQPITLWRVNESPATGEPVEPVGVLGQQRLMRTTDRSGCDAIRRQRRCLGPSCKPAIDGVGLPAVEDISILVAPLLVAEFAESCPSFAEVTRPSLTTTPQVFDRGCRCRLLQDMADSNTTSNTFAQLARSC